MNATCFSESPGHHSCRCKPGFKGSSCTTHYHHYLLHHYHQLQHNHHQYYHNHLQRFRLLLRARLPCSVSERWGLCRAWQVLLRLWLPGDCIIITNLGPSLLRTGGPKLHFNATKCPHLRESTARRTLMSASWVPLSINVGETRVV